MTLTVACPTCKTKAPWSTENLHRPFCSDRCKLIDLGAWTEECHVIHGALDASHVDELIAALESEPAL